MVHLEVGPADLADVAGFVAGQQADPASAIGYLDDTAEAIAEELLALEPLGTAGLVVARRDGRPVGVLAAEYDAEPPRCWWHGPFVADGEDWEAVADALLARGRALLPATVTEEETFGDERHTRLAAFAARNGFEAQEASAALARPLAGDLPALRVPTVAADTLSDGQRQELVDLHDRLFPGTHTPGRRLVGRRDHHIQAVVEDGIVVGYVAVQQQSDADGYVDFLGVADTARGRGLGSALVAAACHDLRQRGCRRAHLTVRVSNAAARQVYAANGFVQEQILVPYRKGVRLA